MNKLDSMWIAGFVDGEGTFYVGINRNSTMSAGYQVLPEFRIVQHEKDIQILYKLKDYFGCGSVRQNHDDRYELRIRKFEFISQNIIPFFEKNPLQTQKKHDFIKFRKVIRLMEKKAHLTKDGVAEIIRISSKMNRGFKPKALEILKTIEETG